MNIKRMIKCLRGDRDEKNDQPKATPHTSQQDNDPKPGTLGIDLIVSETQKGWELACAEKRTKNEEEKNQLRAHYSKEGTKIMRQLGGVDQHNPFSLYTYLQIKEFQRFMIYGDIPKKYPGATSAEIDLMAYHATRYYSQIQFKAYQQVRRLVYNYYCILNEAKKHGRQEQGKVGHGLIRVEIKNCEAFGRRLSNVELHGTIEKLIGDVLPDSSVVLEEIQSDGSVYCTLGAKNILQIARGQYSEAILDQEMKDSDGKRGFIPVVNKCVRSFYDLENKIDELFL